MIAITITQSVAPDFFTKPVTPDSFSTTLVELLVKSVKDNVESFVLANHLELFAKELKESFYSEEELEIDNKCTFCAMTINNENSDPLLIVVTQDLSSTFDEVYVLAKAAYIAVGENLASIVKQKCFKNNGSIVVVATLEKCANTGTMVAY